jgi:hypothetical protein
MIHLPESRLAGTRLFSRTSVVSGEFPRRALAHVLEWYELHREGLREDWRLAQERRPLKGIPPLE